MLLRAGIGLLLSSIATALTISSDALAAPPTTSCYAFALPAGIGYAKPPPEVRVNRLYSVVCFAPNVSEADMFWVAEQLARGAPARSGYTNEIPRDYAPFGIQPYVRFHDSLRHGSETTTLRANVWARATPDQITKFCTSVNQSGILAKNQNMDREYRCRVQIQSVERDKAQEVGRKLISRDMLAEARTKDLRVCLLPTTDIQCAPCHTSDKLIVRVRSVAKGSLCPAGTIGWVE
jgi:hypothetical protein